MPLTKPIIGTYHSFFTAGMKKDIMSSHTKWGHHKYHLATWVLSFFRAQRVYPINKLVTDEYGKFLLCDQLGLPFTYVSTALEEMQWLPRELWAMGKIRAYQIMAQEPLRYVHIDDDLILHEKLNDSTGALFQNPERTDNELYHPAYGLIYHNTAKRPDFYLSQHRQKPRLAACASVVSFSDNNMLEQFASQTLQYLQDNQTFFSNPRIPWTYNIVIEQWGLYAFCSHHQIPQHYIYPDLETAIYSKESPITHFWGGALMDVHRENLYKVLKEDHPDYYERIEQLVAQPESLTLN